MKIFKGMMKREGYTLLKEVASDGFMEKVYSFLDGIKPDTALLVAYTDTDISSDRIKEYIKQLSDVSFTVIKLPECYGKAIIFALEGKSKAEILATLHDISVKKSLRLTVSSAVDRTEDLFEVLIGIMNDSDCRMVMCNNSVIDSETVKRFDGTIPDDFFACFFAFYNGLKVGNRQLVSYNLGEIKKCIVNIFAPDVFKLAYLNLIHCFSKYLSEECIESHIEKFPQTVDEAFDVINNLTDIYFEKMCISGNNSEYLKQEVLRIVENDFSSPTLSVTMLADRLGVSTSYLSRYFKDKTGVTLFSYIDEIRVAKAKQLLMETDSPVKQIVKAVGYNDINNFNRKFKSKTGQTPSSYRKDHANKF